METTDLQLIEKLALTDSELAGLWKEHVKFEQRLDKLDRKQYLNKEEELELHDLKKKKLSGRDRIENILLKHRQDS